MKQAYLSLVAYVEEVPSVGTLSAIDETLALIARKHEIVIVAPYLGDPGLEFDEADFSGPVTIVATHPRATRDAATLAGLARSVGDFVIEWHAEIARLDAATLVALLEPSDEGVELIEVAGDDSSVISRTLYRLVNSLRQRDLPVTKVIARVYSRHALGQVLAATRFEPQLNILAAELPVHRRTIRIAAQQANQAKTRQRVAEGLTLLSKGTRFGSAIPLGLAAISVAFGIGAAVYAVGILIFKGRTPEGWTTLMIVIGLGQAAILAMLGLTWTRIDSLTRGLSRNHDATASVATWAPGVEQRAIDEAEIDRLLDETEV